MIMSSNREAMSRHISAWPWTMMSVKFGPVAGSFTAVSWPRRRFAYMMLWFGFPSVSMVVAASAACNARMVSLAT